MTNRRALLIPVLAAALMPAAAPAFAEQASVVREVSEAAREIAREVTRATARYQGRNRNRVEQTDSQTRTFRVPAGGVIELHNIAGDITIAAGGGDTATLEIIKRAHAPSEAEARRQLGLVRVEVIERAARVEVRAHYLETRGRNQNINVSTAYRLSAPAGTQIRTDSISGNVSVTGIRGEITLGTISGNLVVRDGGLRIAGHTISGNVELVSAQDNAVVELSSTSGNVRAQGIRVRRLDLGSISGSVIGTDLRCEQATLHTMSGNVEYSGTLTSGGRYAFRTHSGDVRLLIGGGVGFEIEASTFSGEVRTGLQLRVDGALRGRNRTIRGTYGDGRARIDASSFSGNVVINGR